METKRLSFSLPDSLCLSLSLSLPLRRSRCEVTGFLLLAYGAVSFQEKPEPDETTRAPEQPHTPG